VIYIKCVLFSNIFFPFVLVDKEHWHNYNTHSSRLVVVLTLFCNFYIHKNTDKYQLALFPLFCAHILGKLLLIVI